LEFKSSWDLIQQNMARQWEIRAFLFRFDAALPIVYPGPFGKCATLLRMNRTKPETTICPNDGKYRLAAYLRTLLVKRRVCPTADKISKSDFGSKNDYFTDGSPERKQS